MAYTFLVFVIPDASTMEILFYIGSQCVLRTHTSSAYLDEQTEVHSIFHFSPITWQNS